MKRLVPLFLCLLLAGSLYASVSFGYSAAPVGEMCGEDSFGAVELSGVLSFTGEKHIGDLEADALIGFTEPVFKGVNVTLSLPLFAVTDHPFNYVFPNIVLWEPRLSLGVQYRTEEGHRLLMGFSPLTFADTDFTYEFLSPYLVLNEQKQLGWGIVVMKFTAFIGG